ncbi:MAG: MFS transporter [Rubrobacteraceae bacterium]|nr:MFS transporter [Rubrobacteraceae bacterium]
MRGLRAGRREWIGLAVIALPCLLYSMDLEVLYLAVPSLTANLEPTSSQLLWITDVYGFLLAGLLLTMGTLGDRIGRRWLLLIGAAAFGIASVLAAYSRSAEMLIFARAVLGVAGTTLAPSTLALISNMFLDPAQRAFAIGVWVTSFSAGAALGPLAGGVMLRFFWWGSVFLLAVPVMALLLLLGPVLLPEFRDPGAGRLDLTSAAMSLAAVLTAIYGLKQIAQDGVGWPPVLFILLGLVLGAAFVRRQRRLADPLIDLRLFRVPAFTASLAANTLGIFVIAGIFLFVAQYLQLVLGFSPLVAGLWSLPSAGGLIAGSLLASPLARRLRPAKAAAGGLALAAVGLLVLTQVGGTSSLPILVGSSVVFSLGIAAVVPLTTDIIVGSAPPEKAGAASGISETGTELGGALGIALLGSVGIAVYRNQVANSIPASVPPGAAKTARDTLGGAVGVADQLPGRLGAELLDAAREAFTQALQLMAAASAALAVGTAVLVLILLRGVGAGPVPEARDDTARDAAVPAKPEPPGS